MHKVTERKHWALQPQMQVHTPFLVLRTFALDFLIWKINHTCPVGIVGWYCVGLQILSPFFSLLFLSLILLSLYHSSFSFPPPTLPWSPLRVTQVILQWIAVRSCCCWWYSSTCKDLDSFSKIPCTWEASPQWVTLNLLIWHIPLVIVTHQAST